MDIKKVWRYDDNKAAFVCVSIENLVCDGDGGMHECSKKGTNMLEIECCPGEPLLECTECGAQFSRISADGQDAHDYEEGDEI